MKQFDYSTNASRPGRRRVRTMGVLVLITLVAGGLVWMRAPQPLRLLDAYPMHADQQLLNPTTAGFFRQTGDARFTLQGWDGTELWSVTLPGEIADAVRDISCSPDGRIFAVASRLPWADDLRIWQDGIPLARHQAPSSASPLPQRFSVQAMNDGRVFLAIAEMTLAGVWHTQLTLYDGMSQLAAGHIPGDGLISPDGLLFVRRDRAGVQYATLTVYGQRISHGEWREVTGEVNLQQYLLPGCKIYPSLFAGGRLLDNDATVYDPMGQRLQQDGWQAPGTISPNGQYTLLTQGRYLRILSPVTGDAWDVRRPGFVFGGDVTDDGRYAMVLCQREFSSPVGHLADLLPLPRGPRLYVAILERPGRVRVFTRFDHRAYQGVWISPSGRELVLVGPEVCELYRW